MAKPSSKSKADKKKSESKKAGGKSAKGMGEKLRLPPPLVAPGRSSSTLPGTAPAERRPGKVSPGQPEAKVGPPLIAPAEMLPRPKRSGKRAETTDEPKPASGSGATAINRGIEGVPPPGGVPVVVTRQGRVRGPLAIELASGKTSGKKVAPAAETTAKKGVARTRRSSEPLARRNSQMADEQDFEGTVAEAHAVSGPPTPERNPERKRILFVTAECTPLAQTGGLGDAVAGLSKALLARGHEVRLVLPLYASIDRARFGIEYRHACCVHFGGGEEIWVGVHEGRLDGQVPIWFIDYDRFFGRPGLYYDGAGEYRDNAYRFGLLSKAALQVCKDVGFIPHVVHAHDWMTAMAPVFLKTWDNVLSPLSETASVLTIHNIGYQGKFDASVLKFYGFGADYLTPDRLEDFGGVNLLKAGIQYADMITTVSPTYAEEIRGPVGGMGLDGYLRARLDRVSGVLNGVDTEVWNPATDPLLPARYSADDLSGKAACKRALQERFGLRIDPRVPIFGVVSRFAEQKGFDLLRGALPQALRDMLMQVVVLGTGDGFTESFFGWLSRAFPGSVNAHIGFSPELAHLIEAGSDFFLMPSLYEPCGLNQMYSSLYGTLPIVRATGGLEDTVENYDEKQGTGTGFKFRDISDRALYYTIGWAVATWYDRPLHYRALQRAGMLRNFSWAASAAEYEKVYTRAVAYRVGLSPA